MSPLNITVKNDCRLPVMVREAIEKEYKGEPIASGFNGQHLLDFSHGGRAVEGRAHASAIADLAVAVVRFPG